MENFNFNRDFYDACAALGERDGAKLAFALLRYGYEGIEPDSLPPALYAAFTLAKGRVNAMAAGSKGGKRRASSIGKAPSQVVTQDPSQGGSQGSRQGSRQGSTHVPSQQKEKEIKEDLPNGKSKKTRFTAPSAEAVAGYAASYLEAKGAGTPASVGFDAERFVDFYASKGWKIGRSPMKDWQAAVRSWLRNGRAGTQQAPVPAYVPSDASDWGGDLG